MADDAPQQNEPDGPRQRLLESVLEYFAANGVGDASLRQIAASVGTSHRMLIYHFGSRDGLLEAVVEELERTEREVLAQLLAKQGLPKRQLGWEFWTHIADVVEMYGSLYFELASQAMHGDDLNAPLRVPNVEAWIEAIAAMREPDMDLGQARAHARLNLAVARGLLHDFLLTRDRKGVDEAMAMFDFITFREPNPVKRVAKFAKNWEVPRTSNTGE